MRKKEQYKPKTNIEALAAERPEWFFEHVICGSCYDDFCTAFIPSKDNEIILRSVFSTDDIACQRCMFRWKGKDTSKCAEKQYSMFRCKSGTTDKCAKAQYKWLMSKPKRPYQFAETADPNTNLCKCVKNNPKVFVESFNTSDFEGMLIEKDRHESMLCGYGCQDCAWEGYEACHNKRREDKEWFLSDAND